MRDHGAIDPAAVFAKRTLPLKLALITDDARIAALAHEALGGAGHNVEVVGVRKRATLWNGLSTPSHDAIFVDTSIGASIVRETAKHFATIVAIGGPESADAVVGSLRSGASDYLLGEVTHDALLDAAERISERSSEPSRAAAVGDGETTTSESPAPARVTLRFHDLQGDFRSFALDSDGPIDLGRDPANALVFDSQVVSRFHATLTPPPAGSSSVGWTINDRESRHGVIVNDQKIGAPHELRDGDVIRLGKPGAPELFASVSHPSTGGMNPDSTIHELPADDAGREIKSLANLLDTFLQLNSELVLDDVLALVVERSIEFAAAERGMILLLEDEELSLVIARTADGREVEAEGLEISRKIPDDVLSTGKGLIFEDLLDDSHVGDHSATIKIGVRSAMCVPLASRRRVKDQQGAPKPLGVLYVDSRQTGHPFSEQLLHALESLAGEAAQAIVNARLYEVSLEKRRIDEEMRLAREIQENFLPARAFESEWVELCGTSASSLEVGGDVLDYFPRERRLGVLVGDVSGKGVPAAIFSAMLDGHFHAFTDLPTDAAELGEVAQRLNAHLLSRSGDEKFVTLVFAVLRRNGELAYINAGHNPPIVVKQAGKTQRLPAGGTILGMLEEATYQSDRTDLQTDDVLVLYSDGVTEARSPDGEFFSLERLERIVTEERAHSAETIHDKIIDEWNRFTAGEPAADDVTLMVVKKR